MGLTSPRFSGNGENQKPQQQSQSAPSRADMLKSGMVLPKEEKSAQDMLQITPEFFGPLLPFIKDDKITDVDFNGTDLWVRDCEGHRYKVPELKQQITDSFIQRLTQRIQNSVSKEFNPQHPLLEAETKTLRISVVHESRCNGRRSLCFRKVLPSARIDTKTSVDSGYASIEILSFLQNAVKSHFNVTICGEPGTGKTEFAKYISLQIPDQERVITIEDSLEWHYHAIKPLADCVEMQTGPAFDYYMAIKACLRQNPNWIMISEVRGKEVANYLQQLTTGVNGITTLHTDDVRRVPDRLCNMAADTTSRERTEADIYSFLDIAVLIDMVPTPEGYSKRRLGQVCMFFNDHGEYKTIMIYDNGQLVNTELPEEVLARFRRAHIEDPFFSQRVQDEVDGKCMSIQDEQAMRAAAVAAGKSDPKLDALNPNKQKQRPPQQRVPNKPGQLQAKQGQRPPTQNRPRQ